MKTIAVFPGQGAQAVGMGAELYASEPVSKAVFDEVDEALGQRLTSIIFEGPEDQLLLTANAQPALMATSLAAVRALEARIGQPLASWANYAAGHSLGEYSALASAGAISITDAAKLLRIRGEAMQSAVPVGEGAMAAILGLNSEKVSAVAKEAAAEQVCDIANDNADGQVVLSGHKAAVERACDIAKAYGAKRAMLLQVSAPFHCSLMQPAAERLGQALENVAFEQPVCPVICNVNVEPTSDPGMFRSLLKQQVTGRVRWRETMDCMRHLGAERIVEFGAGKVLTGLAKRALRGTELLNVQRAAELDTIAAKLST